MLDEFVEVTTARLAQLHALTAQDLKREVVTPAGPGTVADMLRLVGMDTYWEIEERAAHRPTRTAE